MSHFRPPSSRTSSDDSGQQRQIVANFEELGLLARPRRPHRTRHHSSSTRVATRKTIDRSYSNGTQLQRSNSTPSKSSAPHPLHPTKHTHLRPAVFSRPSHSKPHTYHDFLQPRPRTPKVAATPLRPSNSTRPSLRPSLSQRQTNTLRKVNDNLDLSVPRRPIIRFATNGGRPNFGGPGIDPQDHFDRIAQIVRPIYNSRAATSFNWRAGGMAGMLDSERSRSRRERTFIGSQCAVCDEPLEHTLRGERILQFSCGHVSHEACFYEYIKEVESQHCPTCNAALGLDTSRGGNILDLEKLSSIVRSVSVSEAHEQQQQQGATQPNQQGPPSPQYESDNPIEQHPAVRPPNSKRNSRDGMGITPRRHTRNDSTGTGPASSGDEAYSSRKHDYDVHAMESNVSARSSIIKSPIPAPMVTVRSEFPTLTRSRQQQSLTCLITVEVSEGKWRPDPADIRGVTPPPVQQPGPPPPDDGQSAFGVTKAPPPVHEPFIPFESPEVLEDVTEDLRLRVDNWHGLDFQRFGKLRLFSTIRVGKDKQSWQELECFLFAEMLICVKEKKNAAPHWDEVSQRKLTRCTLKGSILIKKHLKQVSEAETEENILTLSLSVAELPSFHLQFPDHSQLEQWKRALLDLNGNLDPPPSATKSAHTEHHEISDSDDEDYRTLKTSRRVSSTNSWTQSRSVTTAPTEYTAVNKAVQGHAPAINAFHVPLDIVVVIPVSSSMQGLKITLLRDSLKFLVQNLGERDRMGLVTFGSGAGGVPLVGMTSKSWNGWSQALDSIRPVGQKSLRADVVEGANVAMDLLMQRKSSNPIGSILLISDSSTADVESVDFVISRAEAAKVPIHSFGLGLTHKPDTMIELSTRTKASYTYVKDWMMLRECVAGVVGSLQTLSHQNAKLKLKLPEGSPARFVKISGALQITKRATGKDAEAALGDLRFGDKRDILVQLVISPDTSSQENLPQDPWESIVSGLEALGGPLDSEETRGVSIEEVPLIQADLTYGDILRDGILTHLPRPSLLAITMLPASPPKAPKNHSPPMSSATPVGASARDSVQPSHVRRTSTPPIPPHPSIVQRRMELLTSDMLTRALTLVSRGQHDRAHHLLRETRSILKGLGKGGLPPIPSTPAIPPTPVLGQHKSPTQPSTSTIPTSAPGNQAPTSIPAIGPEKLTSSTGGSSAGSLTPPPSSPRQSTPSPPPSSMPLANRSPASSTAAERTTFSPASGIDAVTLAALDGELEAALEWIDHPAVFARDARKAVLQAIGVISSQRSYTFRTPAESLWAGRVGGIKKLVGRSREWREQGGGEEGWRVEEC